MCNVADLTVTRLGTIDTGLARATQQSIAIYARFALLALNDVHFRLGIDYTSSGYSPAPEPPTGRWSRLINDLFDIDRTSLPTPSPTVIPLGVLLPADVMQPAFVRQLGETLAAAPHASRIVVARLLTEAGTFLMAECVELASQVETATAVDQAADRAKMTAKLDEAVTAARRLLDHALPAELEVFFFGAKEPAHAAASLSAIAEPVTNALDQQPVWTTIAPVRAAVLTLAHHPQAAQRLGDRAMVVLVGEAGMGKTDTLLRARRVLFEKAMSHGMARETCVAIAVSVSGGVHTDPIQLIPPLQHEGHATPEPVEWLGVALMQFEQQIAALSTSPADDDDLALSDPVARWMQLIECFSGPGYTRPDHVLVLLDESAQAQAPLPMTAVSPQDLVEMLREDGLIPDLTGTSVTVVQAGASDHIADLHEHWLAICAAANAQTCEFDLATREVSARVPTGATELSASPSATSGSHTTAQTSWPRKAIAAGACLVVPPTQILTSADVSAPSNASIPLRRALARPRNKTTLVFAIVHVLVTVVLGVAFVSSGSEAMGAAAFVLATVTTSGVLLNSYCPSLRGLTSRGTLIEHRHDS